MPFSPEDLARVAIRTPYPDSALLIRGATEADLLPLAAVAAAGVALDGELPYEHAWFTRPVDDGFIPAFVDDHVAMLESLGAPGWTLPLIVAHIDRPEAPIGALYLADDPWNFVDPERSTVATSAWLGQAFGGQGYERLARGIALDLALNPSCIGAGMARSYIYRSNAAAQELGEYFEYQATGTQSVLEVGESQITFDVLELNERAYRMRSPHVTSAMSITGRQAIAAACPTPGAIDLRNGEARVLTR